MKHTLVDENFDFLFFEDDNFKLIPCLEGDVAGPIRRLACISL